MIDVQILNADSEFPCFDGGHHDYREDGARIICRRGCGADLAGEESEQPPDSADPISPPLEDTMPETPPAVPPDVEHERLHAILADSIARGLFGDLTAEDGNPVGEETLTVWGGPEMLACAAHVLADTRLHITFADAS